MSTDIQTQLAPVIAFSPSTLDAKRNELGEACRIIGPMQVVDAASLDAANGWLRVVLLEKDAIEGMRTSVTKPMNSALKSVNSWFKPLTELCAAAENNLKQKIGAYASAQRELQAAQYKQAAAAHAAGQHEPARQALAIASQAETGTPQGTSVREVWKAEIINASIVPHEFLIPNEPKIQAHARTTPIDVAPSPIPGVRFIKDQIVTVRRA